MKSPALYVHEITAGRVWLLGAALAMTAAAQNLSLKFSLNDFHGRSLTQISLTANGESEFVQSKDGNAEIKLSNPVAGSWVVLRLADSLNFQFITPWDGRIRLSEGSREFPLVLARRGDPDLLITPAAVNAMLRRTVQAMAPDTPQAMALETQRRVALSLTAAAFGVPAAGLDSVFRAFLKSPDKLDRALSELYTLDYSGAARDLESRRVANNGATGESDAVDSAFFLGEAQFRQGKYADAAKSFEEANGLRGNDVLILSQWGISLLSAREYRAADLILRRVSRSLENLPPSDPALATGLSNLALALVGEGDYDNAAQTFRRVLRIRRAAFGDQNPEVARTLNDLGMLLRSGNDQLEAEPLLREALSIREKTLGPDHPDVARSLSNLALVLKDKKQLDEAEKMSREAVRIYRDTLRPEDPELAGGLNNLAMLLAAKERYDDAESLFAEALRIDGAVLGDEHPATKQIRANLNLTRGTRAGK